MGQTLERMKEGYSKIRNEALAHAFSYMNLIEHWGSGIPRIIDKVKAAGLRGTGVYWWRSGFSYQYLSRSAHLNAISDVEKVPDAGSKMPDNAKKCWILIRKCRIVQKSAGCWFKNAG